jgi:hypothetical protein
VRFAILLCLALGCYAATHPDLGKEDLRAIQRVMKAREGSLDWFRALDKKPVDANSAVMAVEAAHVERLRQIGVFVVSGKANQVQLVLDIYPQDSALAYPTLDRPSAHSPICIFIRITGSTRAASSTSTICPAGCRR